jgi:hypothetical protein
MKNLRPYQAEAVNHITVTSTRLLHQTTGGKVMTRTPGFGYVVAAMIFCFIMLAIVSAWAFA